MDPHAVIAAGFGFRGAATVESLKDALERARRGLSPDLVATAAEKAEAPVFREFAQGLGLPVSAMPHASLRKQSTATRSAKAMVTHGTGSVAEAAALAAAGTEARLVSPRVVSEDRLATCALAEGGVS